MNRQDAIKWCERFIKKWPDVNDNLTGLAAPIGGWKWTIKRLPYRTDPGVILNFHGDNGTYIAEEHVRLNTHGGKRAGAGRPKGEGDTQIRVPTSLVEPVRLLIQTYRTGKLSPKELKQWLKQL